MEPEDSAVMEMISCGITRLKRPQSQCVSLSQQPMFVTYPKVCVTDLSAGQLLNCIFQVVRQSLLFVFQSLKLVFHPNLLLFLPHNLLEEKTLRINICN